MRYLPLYRQDWKTPSSDLRRYGHGDLPFRRWWNAWYFMSLFPPAKDVH